MKRMLIVGLVVLAGCARVAPGDEPLEDPATERGVSIYAAAIRRLTTTSDNTFEAGYAFPVIYVLDRAFPNAGDPDVDTGGEPIPAEVREGILAELADLPIEFVSDRDSVVGPESEGSQVANEGALVTLGTIPAGEERVEVGVSLYVANLAGTWLTYVVENAEEEWTVTGTTGPVAIS